MQRNNILISLILISLSLFSCKNSVDNAAAEEQSSLVISKAQFNSEAMKWGQPTQQPFAKEVHFTGQVVPSVSGEVFISLSIPGIIEKIYCSHSKPVNVGDPLFRVSGNEFIDTQKNYAESFALLTRLSSDFDRIQQMQKEQIITPKEFTLAQSEFLAEQARFNALEMKLKKLGVDTKSLQNGIFAHDYTIKSPIQGVVSAINISQGQYVEPNQSIAEIVDDRSFQLKLSIFENDMSYIAVNQMVKFGIGGNIANNTAMITTISKSLSVSKAIHCFAKIEDIESLELFNNQYVEGQIIVAVDTLLSVPQSAILKSEDQNYVLVLEKETENDYFLKKIAMGNTHQNECYIELPAGFGHDKILIEGVYNIVIE